ncbi:hypothetical protein [Vibrio parahaemolyticus]|uniref:hypothetical protein n=1 Tax=Vibrio parahaemolyticus TaxID=670 RepID=UPI0004D33FCF|nr:hypothetical protein [Vibrio parahaemolyticus]EGR2360405.1 hypothetical protein [Vibrio parahaemolyticus]EGU6977982.1 hypothetical protein [Vibrio parahaemolyticus]EIO2937953.1 hypothetical protein [Vibrio parahaemolyticus]MBE3798224.1 hypothetical protein [Vibrio parahaemolyticus]MBE3849225.1 hypothetical protein [Vibrio parahaemolyticus]
MNNNIPPSDLIGYVIELEKFESTTLEDQVIEKAKRAGFVTDSNCTANLSKLAWIRKVTHHAESAFKLQAIVAGEPLELKISTFKQIKQERNRQVDEILELMATHVLDAVPPYKA